MNAKTHDVYSFGVVSSSMLYGLQGAFPAAEGYAEITSVRHMTGGEATNSSIVLSRLGASVKLDGNWLGADDGGRRTIALLSDYGIDLSRLLLKEGYNGTQELVFAAGGTRTIFGNYCRLLENEDWNMPHESDVTQAKVVCLDPFFREASFRVAEIAHGADIPVVTVDCGYEDPLIKHASAVVIAEGYIRENYAGCQHDELFQKYRSSADCLVIFTFGDNEIWYAEPGDTVRNFTPYPIEPVDTCGGGDAFRAGIVFGFLKQWSADRIIDFAAAAAAIVCTRSPGVLNAPTYDEVSALMQSRTAE